MILVHSLIAQSAVAEKAWVQEGRQLVTLHPQSEAETNTDVPFLFIQSGTSAHNQGGPSQLSQSSLETLLQTHPDGLSVF